MAVNKVIYGNDIIIDLTDDDVTAEDVVSGKSFHLASGVRTTGVAVIPEPATADPLMDGVAAVGSSPKYAKEDHVHPADTSKQDVISDLSTIRSNASNGQTAYTRSTNKVLYFTSIAVSATTGDIATINNSAITADHVVATAVFADPLNITNQVTWTTSSGSVTLNGTCTSATTVNIVLIKKDN